MVSHTAPIVNMASAVASPLLTQDDIFKIFSLMNAPRDIKSAPSRAKGLAAWKQAKTHAAATRSAASKYPNTISRSQSAADGPGGETQEDTSAKKYWEKYAKEAAKELLKDVEEYQDDATKEQLLYSARVGIQPKYAPEVSDDESITTELSLLSCSQVEQTVQFRKKGKRKKRTVKTESEVKQEVNWASYAKERTGLLAKLMRQDTSGIQMDTVSNRRQVSELMSAEERALLMNCAQNPRLCANDKSYSTENIITGGDIKKRVIRNPTPSRGVSALSYSTDGSSPKAKTPQQSRTGCTPSPCLVAAEVAKMRRSESVPISVGYRRFQSAKSRSTASCSSPFSRNDFSSSAPHSKQRRISNMDSGDSVMMHRIQSRVHSTVTALERFTGYGDQTYELNDIPEEIGIFTKRDYSKHPRYPQNIRVAPQLVQIITHDIRSRMGRPRYHELKQQDVNIFESSQPPLDRTHRNLLIFNWLNSTHEQDYETSSPPAIEGYQLRLNKIDPIHTDITCFTGYRPVSDDKSDGDEEEDSDNPSQDQSAETSDEQNSDLDFSVDSINSYGADAGSM